jgi:hypothetical protein
MEQPWKILGGANPDVLEPPAATGNPKFEAARLIRNWNLWLATLAASLCALLWRPLEAANQYPRPIEYWFLLAGWIAFGLSIIIGITLMATLPAVFERLAVAHYERMRIDHRSGYGRLAFLHRIPLQHAFFVLGVLSTMIFVVARPPSGPLNLVRSVFIPIRVRCGGDAFTDPAHRQVWTADHDFTGGSSFKTANPVSNIASPAQGPLYQSQRYGAFRYEFAVPNGTYLVNLKFAEIWYAEPGKRLFDVVINGETTLHNFDILAQAGGPNIAVDRSFIVGPTTLITIDWKPRVDNAEVNAIEILEEPAGAESGDTAPRAQSRRPGTSIWLPFTETAGLPGATALWRSLRGAALQPHHRPVVRPNV